MTPEEYVNEAESARNCRERVERLRALVKAGEQCDDDIDRALRHLRDDILSACDRASQRIANARRNRDQLPHVRRRLERAAAIWRIVRQGFTVELAEHLYDSSHQQGRERMRQLVADFDNASIEDARAIVEALQAKQDALHQCDETECVCRNLSWAIDSLRRIAGGLVGRDD